MKRKSLVRLFGKHDGSAVIFVAVTMLLLLAFAALAIDMGHIYVVRGELQNAADAGALAGAQVLYDNPNDPNDIPGAQVWDGADDFAETFVVQHSSENAPVLVESAERGHWRFGTPGVFTRNDSTLAYDLVDRTTGQFKTAAQLNEDTNFINAVRVITRRKRDPVPMSFPRTSSGGFSATKELRSRLSLSPILALPGPWHRLKRNSRSRSAGRRSPITIQAYPRAASVA